MEAHVDQDDVSPAFWVQMLWMLYGICLGASIVGVIWALH
jgi:hypothetical protein